MTLATGKGGKYRYYKCQSRIAQGNSQCTGKSIPMEKLDALVLKALAEKVTSPVRMKAMVAEARRHLQSGRSDHDNELKLLTRELNDLQARSGRLFEAVETGYLPLDGALQQRAQKLQGRRQEVLIQMAGLKRQGEAPLKLLNAGQVEAFSRALKSKLTANSPFAKQYLRLLVSEIKVNQSDVQMQGSYAALVGAIANSGGTGIPSVPSFAPRWLPNQGSNQVPANQQAISR
jgi:hypothetical protein